MLTDKSLLCQADQNNPMKLTSQLTVFREMDLFWVELNLVMISQVSLSMTHETSLDGRTVVCTPSGDVVNPRVWGENIQR